MPILVRILDLLSANKNLSSAAPYLLKILSSLAFMLLLGVFGMVMAAMLAGFLLWLAYAEIILLGGTTALAFAITGVVTALILGIIALLVRRLWRAICIDTAHVLYDQTPPIGHVSHITGAFMNGLLQRPLPGQNNR
jgi:hypothetical protein